MKWIAATLSAALCIVGTSAFAEGYPSKTVTIVVPYPAGGGTDTTARALAQGLQERLGQTVIVENRPGAGSVIGVDYVAKAKPDGYTLLLASSSYVTNIALGDKKTYDPVADFEPIRQLTVAPAILAVNPAFPADDLQQFLAAVRKAPDRYLYASYGKRTQPHLAALLLQELGDFSIRHVPYKGGSPALTATISGETNIVIPSVVPAFGPINSGQLKPIAIASDVRSMALPDVRTFAEQGVDFELGTWFGLIAPAGTPDDVIAKLDKTIGDMLKVDKFRADLGRQGAIVVDRGQKEFDTFIKSEVTRWNKLRESGLLELE